MVTGAGAGCCDACRSAEGGGPADGGGAQPRAEPRPFADGGQPDRAAHAHVGGAPAPVVVVRSLMAPRQGLLGRGEGSGGRARP